MQKKKQKPLANSFESSFQETFDEFGWTIFLKKSFDPCIGISTSISICIQYFLFSISYFVFSI